MRTEAEIRARLAKILADLVLAYPSIGMYFVRVDLEHQRDTLLWVLNDPAPSPGDARAASHQASGGDQDADCGMEVTR